MLSAQELVMYMVFAALLAIVYSLKRMFLLEKRIASIEVNIERLLEVISAEEERIEEKEQEIMNRLGGPSAPIAPKAVRKAPSKAASSGKKK